MRDYVLNLSFLACLCVLVLAVLAYVGNVALLCPSDWIYACVENKDTHFDHSHIGMDLLFLVPPRTVPRAVLSSSSFWFAKVGSPNRQARAALFVSAPMGDDVWKIVDSPGRAVHNVRQQQAPICEGVPAGFQTQAHGFQCCSCCGMRGKKTVAG